MKKKQSTALAPFDEKTYRGTIALFDVNNTIRDCSTGGRAVPGAMDAVAYAANNGATIVYVDDDSKNETWSTAAFLRDFPLGTLFRRTTFFPNDQRRFKFRLLRMIRATYPWARVVCVGDNAAGDGYAFRENCDSMFLRRAIPSLRNVPCDVLKTNGVLFDHFHNLCTISPDRQRASRERPLPYVRIPCGDRDGQNMIWHAVMVGR
jgi:hypothetical protein